MYRYETSARRTTTRIPRHMMKKTASEIIQYCQENWANQTKMGGEYGDETIPTGKATAMLMATAEAFFDPQSWKAPMYARFPQDADGRDASEYLKAAIIWYHGAEPYETFIGIGSQGYAC